MSMSASAKITNNTGSTIMITKMAKVNDDATWTAPGVGTQVKNGDSFTIAMGNSSAFIAPKGVGFDCGFVCQSNFQVGEIHLDDPAVGAHHFTYGNTGTFSYPTKTQTVTPTTLILTWLKSFR